MRRIILDGILLALAGVFFACNQDKPAEKIKPTTVEQVQPGKVEPRKDVKPIPPPVPMVYRDERVEPPPVDTIAEDTKCLF